MGYLILYNRISNDKVSEILLGIKTMDSQINAQNMKESYTTTESQITIDIRQVQRRISTVVVSSYLIKATAKLTYGILLSVPPLIADGIHGIIDIFEHGVLVLAGRHARKADREKYPLDREPLIDLMGLSIFIGLFFIGLNFFSDAIKNITATLSLVRKVTMRLLKRARSWESNYRVVWMRRSSKRLGMFLIL